MSYERFYPGGWQSGETGGTPITPEALNHMESGIIGAAPAGYGLGDVTKTISTWDNAKVCGWYRSNGNTPNGYYWIGFVITNGTSIVQKIFYPVSGANWQCIRSSTDGGATWGEWEWVNPPMTVGVEYRTTERWNGKVVYAMAINFGAMPNAATGSVKHGITGITQVIRCVGQNITSGQTIPSNYNGNYAEIYADKTNVRIHATSDASANNAYAQLWYTKN